MPDHDEIAQVRERIAEVLWRRACPSSTVHGWEYAMAARERDPHYLSRWFDAADAILDALGVERIGWWQHGTFRLDKYAHDDAEPLFRLAYLSGRPSEVDRG